MFLAYDGIVFDVLLLNGWDQQAVWSDDGADFLYWHHLIDVTCIINPDVISAELMPKKQELREKVNAKLRTRQGIVEAEQLDKDRAATQGNLLPPNGSIPGSPPRSDIQVPPDWKPRTDLSPQDLDNIRKGFYLDSSGDVCQGITVGVPNWPMIAQIAPGVMYDIELAKKTGPKQEPGATSVTSGGEFGGPKATEAYASPAVVNTTTTGAAGTDPAAQIKFPPFRVPENQDPLAPLIGQARPPVVPGVLPPPPIQDNAPRPPGPGHRTRTPGNPNLPATDIELRDRLQVPRRSLKVWVNSGPDGAPEYFLDLPYPGCSMDAVDGPRCINQNMTAIHGNVTGVKRLVFECYEALPLFFGDKLSTNRQLRTKDAAANGVGFKWAGAGVFNNVVFGGVFGPNALRMPANPPLISNRWTMRQVPDPTTFLNTTVVEGKAIFRLDILSRIGMTADQLRKYIMPPLASGYIRQPVEVVQGSLGNEVTYTVVDKQQMMNNPGGLRWGVHDVIILDTMVCNNPIDQTFLRFKPETK